MLTTQALANTILKKAFKEKAHITPAKLQIIIYFICQDWLKRTGKPLFDEPFLAWQNGPVLSTVHYEFSTYKKNPIRRFAKDVKGNICALSPWHISINRTVNKVWKNCKNKSTIELSQTVCISCGAWALAHNRGEGNLLRNSEIKNDKGGCFYE